MQIIPNNLSPSRKGPEAWFTGTVWIEPGELHWHGAAPGRTMVHLAIQETDDNGVDVVWLQHVSDAEYSVSPGIAV